MSAAPRERRGGSDRRATGDRPAPGGFNRATNPSRPRLLAAARAAPARKEEPLMLLPKRVKYRKFSAAV